jgi:hypothetical protein
MLASEFTNAVHEAGFTWEKVKPGEVLPNKIVANEPYIVVNVTNKTYSAISLDTISGMLPEEMAREVHKFRARATFATDFDDLPEKG